MPSVRILLVDDEALLLALLKRHLERAGYDVVATLTAEAALEALTGSPWVPDLLLTDETLPGMRGSELAVTLQARFPHLRGLLCSGYSLQASALPPLLRERFSILQKPYSPPALEAAIRTLLAPRGAAAVAGHAI